MFDGLLGETNLGVAVIERELIQPRTLTFSTAGTCSSPAPSLAASNQTKRSSPSFSLLARSLPGQSFNHDRIAKFVEQQNAGSRWRRVWVDW
jgi:hypothetical protein